jgi:hypothetical protein
MWTCGTKRGGLLPELENCRELFASGKIWYGDPTHGDRFSSGPSALVVDIRKFSASMCTLIIVLVYLIVVILADA